LSRGLSIELTEKLITLYKTVKSGYFYTDDISDIYPPERMCNLSQRGFIRKTGGSKVINGHASPEWCMSQSGISYIKKYIMEEE
jgi:hypothetical protein